MIYPPIGDLLETTKTRYSLVIATSKRARQLGEKSEDRAESFDKAIVEAIEDVRSGKVKIRKYND